jgi:Zn-dependent alcohol dehydrogenase
MYELPKTIPVVKAAGINFAELELTRGKYPALKPLPYILGFEAAGIIAEVGSQVKNLKVGFGSSSIARIWPNSGKIPNSQRG